MLVLEKKDILYYANHPNDDLLKEALKMLIDGDAIYIHSKDEAFKRFKRAREVLDNVEV